MDSDLFARTSGPPNADIVVVGEAFGSDEAAAGRPFVGTSGNELNRMLAEAGVRRDDVLCTNVLSARPNNNEIWRFFHPKDNPSGRPLVGGLDPSEEIRIGLQRLYQQLGRHPRKLVIATGNYALWALTTEAGTQRLKTSNNRLIPAELQPLAPTGIMNWRGSMWHLLEDRLAANPQYSTTKVLPLIHPAAIMRQWGLRSPTVHDLRSRIPMALRNDWRPVPHPVFLAPPS